MGYNHTLSTDAQLKAGTTPEAVVNAFRPILDYFQYQLNQSLLINLTTGPFLNYTTKIILNKYYKVNQLLQIMTMFIGMVNFLPISKYK